MSYSKAKQFYEALGVDVEEALARVQRVSVSLHCWQGDDVVGFDVGQAADGGLQVTGNYPGKARNPQELLADMDLALSLIPGSKRVNLHASYAVSEKKKDRAEIEPEDFDFWLSWAKKNGYGLDFNPTFFGHPMLKDGLTLSSENEAVRAYWIKHAKACRKIAAHFGKELGTPSLHNLWIPDGMKNPPSDRISPRKRLKESLDEIYEDEYDEAYLIDSLESKVFGVGVESYTVGSAEFYMNYAALNGKCCLLDNGHYHPTEVVSDKISSMLLFCPYVALHVTHPVRWDSDHVVLMDDELRAIADEIMCGRHEERVLIGLDYFDATINRIAAWVMGARNLQKALLMAALTPWTTLNAYQENWDFTHLMHLREEVKTAPFAAIWEEYCKRNDVPGSDWINVVDEYEKTVLCKRK